MALCFFPIRLHTQLQPSLASFSMDQPEDLAPAFHARSYSHLPTPQRSAKPLSSLFFSQPRFPIWRSFNQLFTVQTIFLATSMTYPILPNLPFRMRMPSSILAIIRHLNSFFLRPQYPSSSAASSYQRLSSQNKCPSSPFHIFFSS